MDSIPTHIIRVLFRLFPLVAVTIAAAVIVAGATPVYADVYKCDGKWTNKPCSGEVSERFEEVVREPVSETELLYRRKQSLLHDLRMDVIEAERDYGIQLDLTEVERICAERESSYQECSESIETVRRRMNEEKIASKLRDGEDESDNDEERAGGEDTNVAIVVRDDRDCPFHLRRHNRCSPRYRPGDGRGPDDDIIISPRPSTPPKFTPGPFHRVRPERVVDPTRRVN